MNSMTSIKNIEALIEQACLLILCGNEGAANESLINLFDELLSISNNLPVEKMQALTQILPIVLDAQKRRDMVYLADLLQYEVIRILN